MVHEFNESLTHVPKRVHKIRNRAKSQQAWHMTDSYKA